MNEVFLPVEDGILHFVYGGDGPVLLLMHGNGEDISLFEQSFDFLTDNFSTIIMDTRSFGQSTIEDSDRLSFESISQDILRIMEYLDLEKINIFGFSDGGNLGLYFCYRYPKLVDKMIITGANIDPTALVEETVEPIMSEIDDIRPLAEEDDEAKLKLNQLELMAGKLDLNEEMVSQIQNPVLVMAGSEDVVLMEETEWIHDLLLNSDLLIVEDGEHAWFTSQVDVFHEVLADYFLE